MAPRANKKVANSLVTLSSAAIVAVYAAGFMRTKAAAERMEEASNERRPPMPAPSTAGESRTPERIEPPSTTASAPSATTANTAVSPVMPRPDGVIAAKTDTKTVADKPVLAKDAADAHAASASEAPATAAPSTESPAASAAAPATTDLSADKSAEKSEKPAERTPGLLYPKEHYNDGTYLGWGTSRHGDIQASVTITNGRITAASIAQCWTRYSCSWVSHLPPQVVARQSPECDYVSGATQSANAFYWAVVDALNKAK